MWSRRTAAALCLSGIRFLVAIQPAPSAAQTLGNVTQVMQLTQGCPTDRGFDPNSSMVCSSAWLQYCPNVDDLQFVFGVLTPPPPILGTIVMLAGDGGVTAEINSYDTQYAEYYLGKGFQVVQIAWGASSPGTDWEYTNVTTEDNAPSIRAAACRPASFLNWVRNGADPTKVGQGIWGGSGGMCVQGGSAGAGAGAYALGWYNAGAASAATWGQGYLDMALFRVGPVFSNVHQGCVVPNNQATYICDGNPAQAGCNNWAPYPAIDYSLEYAFGDQHDVNDWSGDPQPPCANNQRATSQSEQTLWQQMSIVDFTSSQQPSFNYPNTAMSAWLCETTAPGIPMNNASSQGELFYLQFTSESQAAGALSVNGVTNCLRGPEDVEEGNTVYNGVTYTGNTYVAVEKNMTDPVLGCIKRH